MPLLKYVPNLKYSIFYPLSNQLEFFYVLYAQTKSYHLQSLPSTLLAHMNCTFSDFPRHSCLQDSCCLSHTLTPAIFIDTGIYIHWHLFTVPTSLMSSLCTWYRWLPWSITIITPLSIFQLLTILTDWTKPQSRYSSLCLWGNCTHIAKRG